MFRAFVRLPPPNLDFGLPRGRHATPCHQLLLFTRSIVDAVVFSIARARRKQSPIWISGGGVESGFEKAGGG